MAKRKTALVLGIIQDKTTVSEASRAYDLNPSEVEQWVDEDKRGMENALRSRSLEIKEHYERQLSDLQHASRVIADWIGWYNHRRALTRL